MSTKGQSVIEIIIALAVFLIIASSTVTAVISSLSTSRLAEEETIATFFAEEGISATESIRNENWNHLNLGTFGLSKSNGFWEFFGTSDNPNGLTKYSRTITISDVQRDSNGNIVTSGGSVDPDTKKIESAVTWNFTPLRTNTTTLVKYLTNWQLSKGFSGAVDPGISTCADHCISLSYSSGTCRQNAQQCIINGETNIVAGNIYCPPAANTDACCCIP